MKKLLKPKIVAQSIKENILSGKLAPGAKLPGLSKLARTFDVSQNTVMAAVKILDKQGLVSRSPKSGIYVKSKNGSSLQKYIIEPVTSRAEGIASEIIENIVHGNYRLGNFLPQQKALVFDHRCTNKTIAQALQIVESKGLIHRHGSGYRIGLQSDPRPLRSKSNVCLTGSVDWYSQNISYTNRTFFQAFDTELNRIGITLQFLDTRKNFKKAIASIKKEKTIGFLNCHSKNDYKEEMLVMAKTQLPVIFYNCEGLYPFKSVPKNVFNIQMDNIKAGEDVAFYLALLGHKSIAFMCYRSEFEWAQDRLKGLKTGFEKTLGPKGKIESFTASRNAREINIKRPPRDELKHFISKALGGYTFSHIDPVTSRSTKYLKKVDPNNLWRKRLAGGPLIAANRVLLMDDCHRQMEPHFDKAIRMKGITAWVCVDGLVAIAAVEYLEANGIRVPEDLSLICMDDNENCLVHQITSYDFGKSRLGYLAAHCLLGDIPVRRDRHQLVECPGTIIVRETTRAI